MTFSQTHLLYRGVLEHPPYTRTTREHSITKHNIISNASGHYIMLLFNHSSAACLHATQSNRFHQFMINYHLSSQDCTNLLFINYFN